MTISAKLIADSISPDNVRLTTLELRYPRFIHAEFMTHRVFSRNASSSRAIPVERMIQDVIDDPAMPIHWGKNQKGMQAGEECKEFVQSVTDEAVWVSSCEAWLESRDRAIETARHFLTAGYHKQIVNRLLEPWLHINVVVTATEWDNFFKLRLHPDAQPEIHELARCMKEAMDNNVPDLLAFGDWHLPYVDQNPGPDSDMVFEYAEKHDLPNTIEPAKMLSVARCASVSYKTVDGKPMTMERAAAIYDKLVKADVFHASPFEHQAQPDQRQVLRGYQMWWGSKSLHGNFTGWKQNRKVMELENCKKGAA